MYRRIVELRIRKAWRHLAQGDYEYVLDQFSPRFEYSFAGDHALGGTRHSRDSMNGWFARLFELFPGIRFSAGEPELRWGRITRIRTLEDTQKLAGALRRLVRGRGS